MRKSKAKKLLQEELRTTPIVSSACQRVGVSRQSYYRWIREDSDFKEKMESAIDEGVQHINDLSENQLISLLKEKNFPAIKFWLLNNHKRFEKSNPSQKHDQGKNKESSRSIKEGIKSLNEQWFKRGN